MRNFIFFSLLFVPELLFAQATVKGIISEQNSGNKPISGVQIKALGTSPELTDNAGLFKLVFTTKKPGDRIIVSEISKKGYEIVNKDVVNNWVISRNPNEKTKIVMCPEGLIAQNTLKYYDISFSGLTKGYSDQIKLLKEKLSKSEIDNKTFGEQAKTLAEQFEKQQKQLEELADKFARENFDDCSAIHGQAFESFKSGNIIEAINILETVNSENEIFKARNQKDKAERMIAQSEIVINQNISKLMFQAELYSNLFRYRESEKAFEAAVNADTSNFKNLAVFVDFLIRQGNYKTAMKYANTCFNAAKTDFERASSLEKIAWISYYLLFYEKSEQNFSEAVRLLRNINSPENSLFNTELANALDGLADSQREVKKYRDSEDNIIESVKIRREQVATDSGKFSESLAVTLSQLGLLHNSTWHYEKAEASLNEAVNIYRRLSELNLHFDKYNFLDALNNMAIIQYQLDKYSQAETNFNEALIMTKVLADQNPEAYTNILTSVLNNLAVVQSHLNKFDKAEANYKEIIILYKKLMISNPEIYKPKLARSLSNLASLYQDIKQYQKSEETEIECISLYVELVGTNPQVFNEKLSMEYYGLGDLYKVMDQNNKAENCYDKSLKIAQESARINPKENNLFLAQLLFTIARELYKTNLAQATIYTKESIDIYFQLADSINNRSFSVCLTLMSKFQFLSKNFKESEKYARMALKYFDKMDDAKEYLAHSLLFQGNFIEARKIYQGLKDVDCKFGKSEKYNVLIIEDFDEFEKVGITNPDVKKIRELLISN